MKKLKYIWILPVVILCMMCISGSFLQVKLIKHVIDIIPNLRWGEIRYSGIEEYITSEGAHCEFGASYFLYSHEFVEKFQYLSGDYNYYETEEMVSLLKHGGYELAIMHLTYIPEIYTLAKADIFDNTIFVSEEPAYIYNGYEFYRIKFPNEKNNDYRMNIFNDEKNTIVMIGFCGGSTETGLIGALPDQAGWGEYLKTYFGEYYNFDE